MVTPRSGSPLYLGCAKLFAVSESSDLALSESNEPNNLGLSASSAASESSHLALILLGGYLGDGFDPTSIPTSEPAYVIAADSGYRHATTLSLSVDELVGDLDSITPAQLAEAKATGVRITQYPAEKCETDFELALAALRPRTFRRVFVVGAGPTGMRIDHFLGNVLALQHDSLAHQSITMIIGGSLISVVRERIVLVGTPGDTVSVLPLSSPASNLASTGLLWPLDAAELHAGSLLGMSNQLTDTTAHITVGQGKLLVIQTGEPGPPLPATTDTPPKGTPRTYDKHDH